MVAKDTFSLDTVKPIVILQHMLWESYSECDFVQLPHGMFCKITASLAVAKGACCPWILTKEAIFF